MSYARIVLLFVIRALARAAMREQLATIPMVWRICCEWATWWLPAGLVAAMTAAAGGIASRRDDGAAIGRGTRVNFGCARALIRCARAVHEAGRWAEFGFQLDGLPRAELGAVMERVRRMRSLSSAGDAVQVVEQAGAEVGGSARWQGRTITSFRMHQRGFLTLWTVTSKRPTGSTACGRF